MAKAAKGSDLYFDVLRSMSPSSRLQDAIKEAEKISKRDRQRAEEAQRRAMRAHRHAKKTSPAASKNAAAS